MTDTEPGSIAASAAFLMGEATHYVYSAALRAAAQIGVADHLVAGPRTPDELADRTGTQALAVRRILRLLATREVFREDGTGRFHLTPLAEALRTDAPGSVRNAVQFITGPVHWRPAGELVTAVRTGKPAFDEIFGMPMFDYLAVDAEAAAEFNAGMTQSARAHSTAFAERYPFPESGTLVDVAGGEGWLLLEVLRRHPGLRGVLLDQPGVVAGHVLDTLDAEDRWEVVPGSFFDPLPPDADLYSLQRVLHDWDDEACVRILRNCRHAMSPGGRVVVIESVLPPGNQPHRGKISDVVMLGSLTGRERTELEFGALLAEADLHLTRVFLGQGAQSLSILEAKAR